MTEYDAMLVMPGGDTIFADFKTYPRSAQLPARAMSELAILLEGGDTAVLDRDTQVRPDDGDTENLTGWFTIKIRPRRCTGCGARLDYTNTDWKGQHCAVVWPDEDDPNLLRAAQRRKNRDGYAEVVEFEQSMGRAVSYYELVAHGSDYH